MLKKGIVFCTNLWYYFIENTRKSKKEDKSVIMEKYDIKEIVKWLLKKKPMTHKRLQKCLYFFYGEYLAIKNDDIHNLKTELFKNDFEGWAHGPVSPKIYGIFKGSGYRQLSLHPNVNVNITEEDDIILNGIYTKYEDYTTDDLEKLSHEQKPWKNSRLGLDCFDIGNRNISTEDIFECFKNGINN